MAEIDSMFPRRAAISAMLRPNSVAVIGASAQREAAGNKVIEILKRFGFSGDVLPIHPRASVVAGLPAIRNIEDLPLSVDTAVICIPAESVAEAIERLDAVRCRSAVITTAGFTPGQGERLARVLSTSRLAVNGPNCMGLVNVTDSIPLFTEATPEPTPVGNVGLVAQSGSAMIAFLHSPGLAFSKIISSGDETQVTASDYLDWFAADDATQAVGLVVESVKDPERFIVAANEVRVAGKFLAVLKVGRSAEGQRAVHSHTGAMTGSYDAYQAFFRRLGVPLVADFDELEATLQTFARPNVRRARGDRVAIVSGSGGEAALACDIASEVGLRLAELSDATKETIGRLIPAAAPFNPLDFGANVGRTRADKVHALQAVAADPNVDAIVAVHDAPSRLAIGHDRYMDQLYMAPMVTLAEADTGTKPVIAISSSSAEVNPILEGLLDGSPVPLLRGQREAFVALRSLFAYSAGPHQSPERDDATLPANEAVAALRAEAAQHHGQLPSRLTEQILTAYAVPVVRTVTVRDADEAVTASASMTYPLAVKVASRSIAHRARIGGVVLGVSDDAGLRDAIASIRSEVASRAPQARLEGFELQEMVIDQAEAFAGFNVAKPFAPLILVGVGGTQVELSKQHAAELAPISASQAAEMISTSGLGAVLEGRQHPTPQVGRPFAELVSRLSWLAIDFAEVLGEADLNPVLINRNTGRIAVVDALLVATGTGFR